MFQKINKFSKLNDLVNIKYGLRTGNNKKYLFENDIGNTGIKIARGSSIERYYLNWKPEYLSTIESLPPSYFTQELLKEKIIIQYVRTNSTNIHSRWLDACLIEEENFVPLNSTSFCYVKKDSSINLKYILSILSSNLMNFYYKAHYTDVNVKPLYLSKLPIPKIDQKRQKPFIYIVDEVMKLKKQNQDTTELEDQIDQMVYELYRLSEDEVALVEGKV